MVNPAERKGLRAIQFARSHGPTLDSLEQDMLPSVLVQLKRYFAGEELTKQQYDQIIDAAISWWDISPFL